MASVVEGVVLSVVGVVVLSVVGLVVVVLKVVVDFDVVVL